jgi:predicted dehydrogenase
VIDQLAEISRACALDVPAAHRRGIAHVGVGTIVEAGHAPAYRKAGLPVSGAFDIDGATLAAFAERWNVRAYPSLDALLADDAVTVVDIAVPPQAQPEIVRRALAAGKHVLAQKPFALESPVAEELVALAQRYGRKLAVNQQLRFDEGVAATRAMLERGWIGAPAALEMTVDLFIDWRSWFAQAEQLAIWYHAIHELDAIRSWFGTPESVWCTGSTYAGTPGRGERRMMCGLRYAGGPSVMLHVSTENRTGHPSATFRLDGSDGAIRGTLRRFYKHEQTGPDEIAVWSRSLPTDGWLSYPCTQRWFPDAFIGPMRSLLAAIADGGEPLTAGADNLETVRLVEALYRSIATGDAQRVAATEARHVSL